MKLQKRAIAKVAKRTYFPYRNYVDIIDKSKELYPELANHLESFRSYIYVNRQSLKERDAIKLIRYIKEHSSNQYQDNK